MRRCLSVLFFALVTLNLVFTQEAVAQGDTYGNQTSLLKYDTFVNKLELSYDEGQTWTTVFTGESSRVDLTQGVNAGNFLSGQSIPVGTINRIRVTIDDTMIIKGTVSYGGTTYYTVADYTTQDTRVAGNYANQTENCPMGNITNTETVNINVTAGQSVIVRVTFDISNSANVIRVRECGPYDWQYAVVPQEVQGTITQIQ